MEAENIQTTQLAEKMVTLRIKLLLGEGEFISSVFQLASCLKSISEKGPHDFVKGFL